MRVRPIHQLLRVIERVWARWQENTKRRIALVLNGRARSISDTAVRAYDGAQLRQWLQLACFCFLRFVHRHLPQNPSATATPRQNPMKTNATASQKPSRGTVILRAPRFLARIESA